MIENQNLVPNFVKELYALPSQHENIPLVEDENGFVTEQADGQFQYIVQRKLDGINTLRDTLVRLHLEVVPIEKTKTVNNKTNTYIYLQVRDKDLNNRYEGLTSEDRIEIDTLIASGRVGFNLAKAIVKGEDLNAARELDNQAAEQEAEAAGHDDEENNKRRQEKLISQQFIQAQLDEVFDPAVNINSSIKNNFEGALKNLKDNKNLTVDQEKILFAFIKHTYGSVDGYLDSGDIQPPAGTSSYFNLVHEILTGLDRENLKKIYYKDLKLETEGDKKGVIENFKDKKDKISPNEKLALIRKIEKLKIDVNKLSDNAYTDALEVDAKTLYGKIKEVKNLQNLLKGFQASTVTSDDVKAYGKLQLIKKVFDKITKSANEEIVDDLEAQFKILDGQDDTYQDRLRSTLQNHEDRFSRIQLNLLQKQGLEAAQNIGGLDFGSLEAEEYPQSQETNLITTPNSGKPESLLDGREYNLKFLEDGHVMGMSKLFADKVGTTLNNPYVINAGAAANFVNARSQQAKYLEAAMIKVKQGQAAQLFVSDNGHWTTCSLLPLQNDKFIIIGMDSMNGCSNIKNDIVPKLVDSGKKLGLGIEKDGTENFFNMSVNGQQQGSCCGFASACNGFSLQKTYNDLKNGDQLVKDGNFNKDGFKAALLSNIVYRNEKINDKNRTVLYGNKESRISLEDFVKQFGGLALQEIASNNAMKTHLGENTVEYIKGNQTYIGSQKEIGKIIQNTKKTTVSSQEIAIQYHGKEYTISQEEQEKIDEVDVHKGLETLLNGGVLDSLLSDTRKKAIFIKILKDAFADNKNPYTKKFVQTTTELKNIIHIDDAVAEKIKEVIQAASSNNDQKSTQSVVEISTWDAILLWLYNIPLLGRLVELFGAEVVKCAVEVNKLEAKLKSWEKYTDISGSVNTLIAPSVA